MDVRLTVAGSFLLTIDISLVKKDRLDVPNLLSAESRHFEKEFDSIEEALTWLKEHFV